MIQVIARSIKRFPEIAAGVSFLVICVVFAILSNRFLTLSTWGEILATGAELGIIAVPVALLMISGNFDLSVGSTYALSGMVFIWALNSGLHPVISLIIAIASGAGVGFFNGTVVLKMHIHSFIVTLGVMMLLRGLLLVWTEGFPASVKGGKAAHPVLFGLLAGRIGRTPLRTSAIWFILTTAVLTFVLFNTRHGNWTFATGGDVESARDEGVLVDRVQLINFVIVGSMAAVSGLLEVGRMFSAFPTLGVGMELETIASAVIGGCLLTGGAGSVFGAFIGALLMSTVRIGLVLAGAPAYWYQAFIGLLVIIAVILRERMIKI